MAPLFACLVGEIHFTACQLAGGMRGERLDPPLLLMLDECTRICPIPVPALLADSGGRGIMMILAAQGLAQIEDRWGKPAARSVLDTSNQLYVSGIQDPDTLKMASDLCDIATYQVRGRKDETADYPVATPGMISSLPKRRALVLRGGMPAPVITHLPMVLARLALPLGEAAPAHGRARCARRPRAAAARRARARRAPRRARARDLGRRAGRIRCPHGQRAPPTATATAAATGHAAAYPWDRP